MIMRFTTKHGIYNIYEMVISLQFLTTCFKKRNYGIVFVWIMYEICFLPLGKGPEFVFIFDKEKGAIIRTMHMVTPLFQKRVYLYRYLLHYIFL